MIQIEWEILERKLEGELSQDEKVRFDAWYNADKRNREYFRKIETFYHENGYVKEVSDEMVRASWNSFNSRLKQKTLKVRLRWMTASISACLVFGVLFFSLKWQDHVVNDTNTPIAPGKSKALLTLSTGKVIELENNSDELEDVRARIINTGSMLSYEKKKDSLISKTVIACNEIKTPKGGEYTVTLSDGTKVYLGPFSSLSYPVTFTGEERVVKLSGEAYFDVTRDERHPFIVKMDDMKVKVLGTSFNLRNYRDEAYTEATLVSGRVRVYTNNDSCILEPNYQALLEKSDELLTTRKVDVGEYVDWKDGKLNLRNQRLEDILTRLSKWYDINVFYANENAKDIRFYVNIDRYSDLNELLDKFEKTELVKFEIKGNVVNVFSMR